jgi:uncharacterized membrane protein (DUF2068 family)
VAIVALQALALWVAAGYGAYTLISAWSVQLEALVLAAMVAGFALWQTLTALRLWQITRWANTAAVVQQLIYISLGIASFGGEFGSLLIGWLLFGPATLAFIALLSKPVRELFRRQEED